jgi:hypothetical protein
VLGISVLLGASFAWAAGSTYARVAALPRRPFLAAAMQMLCAGAMLALVGIGRGELGHVHFSAISNASLAAVLFLIVFGSLIAFTAYGWLLKNAPTRLLSTYAYVNPAVAVLLGEVRRRARRRPRDRRRLVILSSVGPRVGAPPTGAAGADSRVASVPHPGAEARVAEVRSAPRLSELYRIAA